MPFSLVLCGLSHLKLPSQHGLSQRCLELPLNGPLDGARSVHRVIAHSRKVPDR